MAEFKKLEGWNLGPGIFIVISLSFLLTKILFSTPPSSLNSDLRRRNLSYTCAIVHVEAPSPEMTPLLSLNDGCKWIAKLAYKEQCFCGWWRLEKNGSFCEKVGAVS